MKSIKNFKFNVVDFFICVIIVAVIFSGISYLSERNKNADEGIIEKENIEVVFEIGSVNERFLDNINIGDIVIEKETGLDFGVVKNINTSDAVLILENGNESVIPETKNVIISVKCESVYNGNCHTINDSKVIINKNYELIAPQMYFSGKCISVIRPGDIKE